jgi:ribosomal protein S18 acetylase RimI-like enzyme
VSGLKVRQARSENVDEIVETLTEAARWLLARGVEQWPDPFPRGRVEPLVRRGEFFVARLDAEPAGALVLRWSDPSFWGEQPDDAGYVHALAVQRGFAGHGLGAGLLDWAEARVVEAGRKFLRLDCMAENAALRGYYERLGFELRGEQPVDEFVAALYERGCRPRSAAGGGGTVAHSTHSGDRHARFRPVRSQRERGWTASPTHKGWGCLL